MLHEIVGLTIDVQGTENSINQLYQIVTYALPFIAALAIAAIAVFYKILQAIKQNAKNTAATIAVANGQLSSIGKAVQEIKSAQSVSNETGASSDISPGSAAH